MKRLVMFMLCLSVYTLSKAQNDAPLSLSLEQALELGNKYNTALKNSAIDVKLAEQKVREILSSGLPQVNASGSVNDYIKSPISLVPAQFFGGAPGTYAEVSFVPKYNMGASLTASQLLFNGSYFTGVKASKEYEDFVRVQQEKTKYDVERDITKAYLAVLSAQESQAIFTEAKNRVDTTLYNLSEMYKEGVIEKLDVDRVKLAQSQLAQQIEQFKSTINVLKALLNLQIGYDVNKPINLTSTIDDLNKKFSWDVYGKSTFDVNRKVEMQIVNKGLELQKLNIKATRMGYAPTLAAFGTYQLQGQNSKFEFPKYYKTFLVGLSLNVPVFDGFNRDSKIRQATLSLQQMENSKVNYQNALTLAYINANTNVTNARNQLDINKQTLELAQSVYTTTKAKYDMGVGSSFEMITADSELKNTKVQYVLSQYNLLNAIFELKTALGQ
jgi:outer membrane protein